MSSHPPRGSRAWRDAAIRSGTILAGRYRIDDVLAIGGMGAVYRGEHLQLLKPVAIKLLTPDIEGFPILVKRFEREAVAGARLDHPHIAAALDFGAAEDGTQFLVSELVAGETLRDIMKQGPLAPARARAILRQIADAVAACHRLGILHRDLKPRNILVDQSRGDYATLIDFGLARVPDALVRPPSGADLDDDDAPTLHNLTLKGIVFGTVAYMAPETVFGMDAVDERSDLYALGIILYEMLAGAHPFDARDPTELFLQHRVMPPPPLGSRTDASGAPLPAIPRALQASCMRLLAKKPSDRYQTAADLVAAIDQGADATTPEARRPHLSSTSTPGPLVMSAGERGYDGLFDTHDEAPLPGSDQTPLDTLAPPTPRRRRRLVATMSFLAVALGVVGLLAGDRLGEDEARPVVASAPIASTLTPIAEEIVAESNRALEREAVAARFTSHVEARRWQAATRELTQWIELDPRAMATAEARERAVDVALRAAFGNVPGAPQLFAALAERGGDGGLDVLYEMVESRGGSRGAALAWEALHRSGVRERAQPALDAALSVREASCPQKESLFERAGEVGDERALRVLRQLSSSQCAPGLGQCCYHQHKALDRAKDAIEKRISAG